MELDFKLVGEKIKSARTAKGLTQEALAEETDLSVSHISAIENAAAKFSITALIRIAQTLEVSTDWLLFNENSRNLCAEPQVARILSDCNDSEIQFLLALLKNNKEALREYQRFETLPFLEK